MLSRFIIMFVLFAAVVGGIAGIKIFQIKSIDPEQFAPPPTAVTTTLAREEIWTQQLEAPGSLQAVQGVMLSTEEAGTVTQIKFESGEEIEKNQILVQLDIGVERAQLKAAVARAELAAMNNDRIQRLKETGALSQKEMDDAESQVKQTKAEVEQIRAAIERKTVRAPFSGEIGIRQVQVGQYLSPGTPIVSLQTMDPIYINFTFPQQYISKLKIGQTVHVTVDAFPNDQFEGTLTAMDPQVDPQMRTLSFQATLKNPDHKLRPGMFGQTSIDLENKQTHITLPATSISRAPYGDSVFVTEKMQDPKGKEFLGVKQLFVEVGSRRGDQIAILNGLKTGQEVVTSGLFKLHPGSSIQINNEVQPENKSKTHLPDS